MRSFADEYNDVERRAVHDSVVLRRRGVDDTAETAGSTSGNPTPSSSTGPGKATTTGTAVKTPTNSGATDLSMSSAAKQRFQSASPMSWFNNASKDERSKALKVGILVVVIVAFFAVLASVATQSGQLPQTVFPRLLFFFVDGVAVSDFRQAAALRRVPSMDLFASQCANCRPSGGGLVSPTPFAECTMQDATGSRVGTFFSLLTGTDFAVAASNGGAATLDALQSRNFSTFLRLATRLGLTTAVLGASPLVTARLPGAGAATVCGILDLECAAGPLAAGGAPQSACAVAATADMPLSAMITRSTSCNTMLQATISPTDTPLQIWERLQYVLTTDTDVIVVHVPEATIQQWTLSHRAVSAAAPRDARADSLALDAALSDVDALFQNALRSVAVSSAQQFEQWLVLLGVANAAEPNLLMASNIVDSGVRRDVAFIDSVRTLEPRQLFTIISDWLKGNKPVQRS